MQGRLFPIFCLIVLLSCENSRKKPQVVEDNRPVTIEVPTFNADSAYSFVEKQVAFGPRVPGTPAHERTAEYIIRQLSGWGATVTVQEFDQTMYDNTRVKLKNIIASFYPEKQRRLLFAAHWDTRPFADKDKNNPNAPMDGANDGASGVAVLMEIARVLSTAPEPPEVGLDIILFDGEDWGERETERRMPPAGLQSWYCLGSQYWAAHKHKPGYSAYYGVLLDMVGAKGGRFFREELSIRYAPSIVDKVWSTARRLGYGQFFPNEVQSEIIDDHKFVTEIGRIPMINIVNYDPSIGSFGSFHHTQDDNMDIISRETLEAVGTTVLHVLYEERSGV
jgi:glutaminyl-peptide cyclotransferase